uniref:F-box domain-containing protein n=1 Tax=Leersia perrieri TaxID=77586 RepID=A0A0D9XHY2_9ORYZ
MPPVRRARARHAAKTPYNAAGWLSRRRSSSSCEEESDNDGSGALLTSLSDDVLFDILPHVLSDASDVARFASTCPRWGRFVATHAARISRVIRSPTRFLPRIALGFFHHENGVNRFLRARARLVGSAQPRFFPAASASQFVRIAQPLGGDVLFDYAQPVASRNGHVVFELRRDARTDGLRLGVFSPMTGDMAVLPSLSGDDSPGSYACTILAGDDLTDNALVDGSFFFRVLLIYNRRSFTALRCYSSDTGSWSPERRKPGGKMRSHTLRRLGHAVVVDGVAYWPLPGEAFGVRMSDSSMDVSSVPYRLPGNWPDLRLLGVSSDGKKLRYITAGFVSRVTLSVSLRATYFEDVDRSIHDVHVRVPGLRVTGTTPIKLRWFGEKSGTVLFTVGEADGGVFALNMANGTVEKLADGGGFHVCSNIYGYEMDHAALLASLAY